MPSHLAIRIGGGARVVGCALDLERGIYYRRSQLSKNTPAAQVVEQRWYAHRTRKNTLVMELELLPTGSGGSPGPSKIVPATAIASVSLDLYDIGNLSTNVDVDWTEVDMTSANVWRRKGNTKQNEDGSVPGNIEIAWVSTPIPASTNLSVGESKYFFGVGESTITDLPTHTGTPMERATATYSELDGMSMAAKAGLSAEHKAAWLQLWGLMTIEVDTDRVDVQRAINSTLYGLLSLHDETNATPFPGSPADGLTLGSFGHWGGCYLWDADMWMYPALALWRPDFVSKMLQYRVDRLPGAIANAKSFGQNGAKFPWMTCGSGVEAATAQGNVSLLSRTEIHGSGDVVFEAEQYWRLTGSSNLTWLEEIGLPLAAEVANYYAGRASARNGSAQLHMDGVTGPDENHLQVNDSGYVIGVAITTLNFAAELAEIKARHLSRQGDPPPRYNVSWWKDVAQRLAPSLPYNSAQKFHPEFDGMSTAHFKTKQADTLMLQFPLQFNHTTMTQETRLNDLEFYSKHSLVSPDMTQAIYSIIALELGQPQLAASMFNASYQNFNFSPYYTWSERANGAGNVPYLTSGGGFLQNIIYGYAGIRVQSHRLRFQPVLIEGATRTALRRIAYCGARLDLEYNSSVATLSVADDSELVGLSWQNGSDAAAAPLPAAFATGQEVFVLCPSTLYNQAGSDAAVGKGPCNIDEDCNLNGDCVLGQHSHSDWEVEDNENAVWGRSINCGGQPKDKKISLLGAHVHSTKDCWSLCNASTIPCRGFAYHHVDHPNKACAGGCYGLQDDVYQPHAEAKASSGKGPRYYNGRCRCRTGWVGETCGLLDLQDMAPNAPPE